MPADTRCLRVLVSGRVQGVSFRYYTQQQAIELGITGWVRNLPDGRVETLICGTPSQLDAMLAWLAHGPESASVSGCKAEAASPEPLPDDFTITY